MNGHPMKDELQQYEVEPPARYDDWKMRGVDGYDRVEIYAKEGWHLLAGWGDGYELGEWPYVMVYIRKHDEQFEVLENVEGDVAMYCCPSREIRSQIIDEIALFWWKLHKEDWVEGIDSSDQMPDSLRGKYSRKNTQEGTAA